MAYRYFLSFFVLFAVLLPVGANAQSSNPPSSDAPYCPGGWVPFQPVSLASDNDPGVYGRPILFPRDNYFALPPGPVKVLVQLINIKSPYTPVVNVFQDNGVHNVISPYISGATLYISARTLTFTTRSSVRVQSQFASYLIWYCLQSLPTPTPTPTLTPTVLPTSTPGRSYDALICLDHESTYSQYCVPLYGSTTPFTLNHELDPSSYIMEPIIEDVSVQFAASYSECYTLWPGISLDFTQIPLLSNLGLWQTEQINVCVRYYSFSFKYGNYDLSTYLGAAVLAVLVLAMIRYWRHG